MAQQNDKLSWLFILLSPVISTQTNSYYFVCIKYFFPLPQDVSFYESIQIAGKQATILNFFLQIAPLQGK